MGFMNGTISDIIQSIQKGPISMPASLTLDVVAMDKITKKI